MTALSSSPQLCSAHPPGQDSEAFRLAMRQLASGVSLVTHGHGASRNGLTATSVSSLSADPPTLIVCVNRSASLCAQLAHGDLFGVSVLAANHGEFAETFAGRTGRKGEERFREGEWTTTPGGVSVLADAIASFECATEDLIERHSHVILIGRVRLATPRPAGGALLYWRGGYDQIGWSDEQLSRAVGLSPARTSGVVLPFSH